MNAYIYDADIMCEDCGSKVAERLDAAGKRPPAGEDYDSSEYPVPVFDGGGEADSPQHCGECQLFLKNPLTSDGVRYVREAHTERPSDVTREWVAFYSLDPNTED